MTPKHKKMESKNGMFLDACFPEAVFDISYFRNKPEAFYTLATELLPGKILPDFPFTHIKLMLL